MLDISPEAAKAAYAASVSAPRFTGPICCARAYVQFSDKPSAAAVKALAKYGLRVMPRPSFRCKALYVGYDNATGIEYGKAEAIAAALSAAGISCYADADMD